MAVALAGSASTVVTFVEYDLRIEKLVKVESRKELASTLQELGLSKRAVEEMWLIGLDADRNIMAISIVGRGGFSDVLVSIPAILAAALKMGTTRFVLAHNHPSQDIRPSRQDIELTKSVLKAARSCDMWFEDHLILISDGSWTSMSSLGYVA